MCRWAGGAMLSERAPLAAQGLNAGQARSASQESQALASAVAIDLVPGTSAAQRTSLVRSITSADPDGISGGTYELRLDRVRAAAILNAEQMGGQPLTLALGLAAAAVLSLTLAVLQLAAGAAVLMLTGNLLAAVPAVVAHRTDPAAALRSK